MEQGFCGINATIMRGETCERRQEKEAEVKIEMKAYSFSYNYWFPAEVLLSTSVATLGLSFGNSVRHLHQPLYSSQPTV